MRLVSQSDTWAKKGNFPQDDYDLARFAVCPWADEMILASAWNFKFLWQREQLQRIYYNTTEAGEEVFERLNALGMLQRSVREVYYFRLGLRFPLAEFFANWVEKGYPGPSQKTKPPLGSRVAEPSGTGNMSGVYRQPERNICVTVNNKHIRRLWARGAKKKEIVCGFLRDSIDSIGRPFPLLIIGEGNLDSWEENLDLLPCVCERTWSRLEYISMKNIFELKQFERGILTPPLPAPIGPTPADLSVRRAASPARMSNSLPISIQSAAISCR